MECPPYLELALQKNGSALGSTAESSSHHASEDSHSRHAKACDERHVSQKLSLSGVKVTWVETLGNTPSR
jgi:hypothetical protein